MKFSNHYFNESIEDQEYIVVYSGRFQPFHVGHKQTYDNLVDKFGEDRVVIGTSNKVEEGKSPFNFEEKKKIITTMFDIPEDKVVLVKNPYAPAEVLDGLSTDTAYITAVGDKDADRLSKGKYFDEYNDDTDMVGYEDGGYVFATPPNTTYYNDEKISGTLVRNTFGNAPKEEQEGLFNVLYPKFDQEIFDLITSKIG